MAKVSRAREVVDRLLDAIIARELRASEQLPPEGDIAAQLGVSRLTVREAVRL
ncbi:GntR family transcriptional regulator, partial [Klebsiella pneumoniae]|uniref:GntR family transcriptional regulator n=1 Tax=Klebsiella pneumoniae TaxID=573 RepID=UPI003AF3D4D7|nr:GntR family transcriptional regulator [Klebsiella pneumoniae]